MMILYSDIIARKSLHKTIAPCNHFKLRNYPVFRKYIEFFLKIYPFKNLILNRH